VEEDDDEEAMQKKIPLMKIADSTLIISYMIGAEMDYRSSVRK
jgi:hypothetical protein